MKRIFIASFLFNLCLITNVTSQPIHYEWSETGEIYKFEFIYSADSTTLLIRRKKVNTQYEHRPLIRSSNSIIFKIDGTNSITNQHVELQLDQRKYIFIPFDPTVYGVLDVNREFNDQFSLLFRVYNTDTNSFSTGEPEPGEIFWCSCRMEENDPGDCVSNLQIINGSFVIRCLNSGNCDACVGWLGRIHSNNFNFAGGGIFIEVKDFYAYNLE